MIRLHRTICATSLIHVGTLAIGQAKTTTEAMEDLHAGEHVPHVRIETPKGTVKETPWHSNVGVWDGTSCCNSDELQGLPTNRYRKAQEPFYAKFRKRESKKRR